MLKMTINDLERDHRRVYFGSERELMDRLLGYAKHFYPDFPANLDAAVAALNATDLYQVTVEPYVEPIERNLLPEDYLTAEQGEDPWPRASEKDVI
jgi:hypothetical protein